MHFTSVVWFTCGHSSSVWASLWNLESVTDECKSRSARQHGWEASTLQLTPEQRNTCIACVGDRLKTFTDHVWANPACSEHGLETAAGMNSCRGCPIFNRMSRERMAFVRGHSDHNSKLIVIIKPWHWRRVRDGSAGLPWHPVLHTSATLSSVLFRWQGLSMSSLYWMLRPPLLGEERWRDQTKFHPESAESGINYAYSVICSECHGRHYSWRTYLSSSHVPCLHFNTTITKENTRSLAMLTTAAKTSPLADEEGHRVMAAPNVTKVYKGGSKGKWQHDGGSQVLTPFTKSVSLARRFHRGLSSAVHQQHKYS